MTSPADPDTLERARENLERGLPTWRLGIKSLKLDRYGGYVELHYGGILNGFNPDELAGRLNETPRAYLRNVLYVTGELGRNKTVDDVYDIVFVESFRPGNSLV